MIMSGWFDLAVTGASFVTNRDQDPFFAKSTVERCSLAVLGPLYKFLHSRSDQLRRGSRTTPTSMRHSPATGSPRGPSNCHREMT
jgi:hypothetical protein